MVPSPALTAARASVSLLSRTISGATPWDASQRPSSLAGLDAGGAGKPGPAQQLGQRDRPVQRGERMPGGRHDDPLVPQERDGVEADVASTVGKRRRCAAPSGRAPRAMS